MSDLPDNMLELLNANRGGFNEAMGLSFTAATPERVEARVEVGEQHLQPYGMVHGGVLSAMIETLASVGAALTEIPAGRHVVGLENTTSFVRAARGGVLVGVAVPVHCGRRSHVWEATIRDDEERVVAVGRVRIQCLEGGTQVAGETVGLAGSSG